MGSVAGAASCFASSFAEAQAEVGFTTGLAGAMFVSFGISFVSRLLCRLLIERVSRSLLAIGVVIRKNAITAAAIAIALRIHDILISMARSSFCSSLSMNSNKAESAVCSLFTVSGVSILVSLASRISFRVGNLHALSP